MMSPPWLSAPPSEVRTVTLWPPDSAAANSLVDAEPRAVIGADKGIGRQGG